MSWDYTTSPVSEQQLKVFWIKVWIFKFHQQTPPPLLNSEFEMILLVGAGGEVVEFKYMSQSSERGGYCVNCDLNLNMKTAPDTLNINYWSMNEYHWHNDPPEWPFLKVNKLLILL